MLLAEARVGLLLALHGNDFALAVLPGGHHLEVVAKRVVRRVDGAHGQIVDRPVVELHQPLVGRVDGGLGVTLLVHLFLSIEVEKIEVAMSVADRDRAAAHPGIFGQERGVAIAEVGTQRRHGSDASPFVNVIIPVDLFGESNLPDLLEERPLPHRERYGRRLLQGGEEVIGGVVDVILPHPHRVVDASADDEVGRSRRIHAGDPPVVASSEEVLEGAN
mmetsp:Transcript_49926/g.116561  ORF Transcript_49926/g.116561 Transcript_49926/m.116561 type:complete len:219 (-) Transcript_49926:133-789(-)